MSVRIALPQALFGEHEQSICESGEFSVSAFRYASGVAALRLKNARGEITVLPYQGQQVWRAEFDGRELTMRSMFDEPVETRAYLETYGGFLIHCGITGLGAPGETDSHPLHGELPNAPMRDAWLEIDPANESLTVVSTYQYTVAFSTNYRATVSTSLAAGSALINASVAVENLKQTPMDLMYLGHANFRPVDYGELHYTAEYDAASVRVRQSIPSHITPKPGYADFLAQLAEDPTPHHVFDPALAFDPEVVVEIDMKADADGKAHALQKHPEGFADYISYRPEVAPVGMRWICRTPDQDGLGVAFPATSGVEGYTTEKAKGRVFELAGGDTWTIDMQVGHLTATETADMIDQIETIRRS
ncbi:MAG: DUF4432 family protein [Pseudomonadota bacterium]